MTYEPKDKIEVIYTGNTFEVEEKYEGGMGIVYKALRQEDKKLYALKTFKNDNIKSYAEKHKMDINDAKDELARRFEWESQVWIMLGKHKNIVQAHWFDWSQNYEPFLIMEYVEGTEYGTTIKDLIKKEKNQKELITDLPSILKLTIYALTGLIYAGEVLKKEMNIPFIHRDIKPANLFISKEGILKVSDFGLVKAFDFFDQIGGTAYYMPPEQWKGQEVEDKTDVYAIGCVIYEMIKLEPPFVISEQERDRFPFTLIRKKHMEEPPKPLEGVPQELNDIVLRCLKKESTERPSLKELRKELQDLHEKIVGQKVIIDDEAENFSADDWNQRGTGFYHLNLSERAMECFNKAISLNPNDKRFYLNRGNVYFRLEKLENAIKEYKIAIRIDPKLIEAYISIASILCKMHRYQEAMDYYNKASRLDPKNAMVYLGRGIVYSMIQEYDQAIVEFEYALEINEKMVEAWLGLGNVCACLKDYEEAERCYNKAISIKPRYVEAYQSLANIYESQGNKEKLEMMMEKIGSLNYKHGGQNGNTKQTFD